MKMNEIRLEEYKLLTQEIRDLLKEARQLELYCGGAVAALYSWYVTVNLTSDFGWFLPLLIPVLGIMRSWAIHGRARQMSKYLMKIEASVLGNKEMLGSWEIYYAKISSHGITPSGILFWLFLTLVCLIFPFIYESSGTSTLT
jgi:hypothetical protein